MTIKEASVKFNLDEKVIRARKKENMIIGVRKDGNSVVIPNDTVLIPSKKDIQSFLLQIIKYKNNKATTISRAMCPQKEQLQAIMIYLYQRGFVGKFEFSEDIENLFDNIQITDIGFDFVFGYGSFDKLSNIVSVPVQINPSFSFSAIKVG
jgi:hypothetical protein